MARLVVVHVHDAATIEDREERTEDHEAAARRRVERRDDLLDVIRDDHRDGLARVRDVRRDPLVRVLVHRRAGLRLLKPREDVVTTMLDDASAAMSRVNLLRSTLWTEPG